MARTGASTPCGRYPRPTPPRLPRSADTARRGASIAPPRPRLTAEAACRTDGPPATRRAVIPCRYPQSLSVRVRARDVGAGDLRRGVDLRVARVGQPPSVRPVPRVPVHLLRVRIVGDCALARCVLLAEPGLPGGGGHHL